MQTPDSLSTTQLPVQGSEAQIFPYIIQLADILIWPAVLLMILWFFSREFKGIFKRLESLDLSSSGLKISTFEEKLSKMESISDIVSDVTGTSKTLEKPEKKDTSGGSGTSKNVESPEDPIMFEKVEDSFIPSDPKMKVTKVRIDLEAKLRNIAQKNKIRIPNNLTISQTAMLLKTKGAIDSKQYIVMDGLIDLTDNVMKGFEINKTQADAILEIYKKLP